MALPEQERFSIEEVAKRWDKEPNYVNELIRTIKFTHIIIVGEQIGSSTLTRHLYFDEATWIEHYGSRVAIDQKDQQAHLKECETLIARFQQKLKEEEKQKKAAGDLHPGETLHWDPTSLRKQYEQERHRSFYNIGPDEVANLWKPVPRQDEWTRPTEEPVEVLIPLAALRKFEQDHDLSEKTSHNEVEDYDRHAVPDLSKVDPAKWYRTNLAARFLGKDVKYLRNELIPSKKLASEKRGRNTFVSGQAILDYSKKYCDHSS